MVGILRAGVLAGALLAIGGCAGTDDESPAGTDTAPVESPTPLASPTPGPTAGDRTDAATPPSPRDAVLEVFASPSGVVCDLDVMDEYDAPRYDGARWAKCWVPDPQYAVWTFDDEGGPVELTCEEDLAMVWPYNSEQWMECVPHESRDVPTLAAGSTTRSSGFECTIGDDIIECLTDDGSGFGFRIGNALFEGLGQ
ncbi:MAG: hypothetical protein EOL89_06600 [Actinobacteria bacterium]|nr:hypothetical protein [Actinomycetota bacterium]